MSRIWHYFSSASVLDTVNLLRAITLAIKLALLFFVNTFLEYQIPWLPVSIILICEMVFIGICFASRSSSYIHQRTNLLLQLLADVCFLAGLLYYSGGATNAFVSLLLIPIAIAAVTLPFRSLAIIAGSAIAVYSFLLWMMPMSVMHGNMQGHFIGMWINFLFSAAVVSLVIAQMARAITRREIKLATMKDEQLKQEKVMAIGIASAQVTHNLATPLSTIRLLSDEIAEDGSNKEAIEELNNQVERCCDSLHQFREMTLAIKEHEKQIMACETVFSQIKQQCILNYPNTEFEFNDNLNQSSNQSIESDSALIPSIINVIDNGIKAGLQNGNLRLEIQSVISKNFWQLTVRDFGSGLEQDQAGLIGNAPVISNKGFGVAMLLSSSTVKRLGGQVSFSNHQEGGAEVCISLPLAVNES